MKYTPRHDTQYEPRTVASPYDCNLAACGDALRFWSLNLRDRNHHQLRADAGLMYTVLDDLPGNEGTNIHDAEHVLQVHGAAPVAWDSADGREWADVVDALRRGAVVIAHGSYAAVPPALRGSIDRSFTGRHSVLFHSIVNDRVKVGDGLSDPWLSWPVQVARDYMEGFPGTGLTFLALFPRRLRARVDVANVREAATTSSPVIARLNRLTRVHYGGTVTGQLVGSSRTWYKVWVAGKVGYCHQSVITTG